MSDRIADSVDDHHGWQAGFQQHQGALHPVSTFVFHHRCSNQFSEEALLIRSEHCQTWSFPGADIGSDHDLLMMTFRLRLKKISKPKHTRLKFDLEKLKDPNVLETSKP